MHFDNDIQKLMLAETVKRQHDARELMDRLSVLIKNAVSLNDGTPVFRDTQMQILKENGHPVPVEELSNINWKADAPSYEEYLSIKMNIEVLEEKITTLKEYKNDVLGYIRMRMSDHLNPPSMEEMNIFQSILRKSPK